MTSPDKEQMLVKRLEIDRGLGILFLFLWPIGVLIVGNPFSTPFEGIKDFEELLNWILILSILFYPVSWFLCTRISKWLETRRRMKEALVFQDAPIAIPAIVFLVGGVFLLLKNLIY